MRYFYQINYLLNEHPMINILEQTDIYLIDQILKQRYQSIETVLDAGCGKGRNMSWFIENKKKIYGVDQSQESIDHCKNHYPQLSEDQLTCQSVGALNFENNFFDLVISNAVLHFAHDDTHFEKMLNELWRVVKPGGTLFIRLTSSQGIVHLSKNIGGNCFTLPDGSDRYLVSLERMHEYTHSLSATLMEPIKTTLVEEQRAMATWILKK